MGVLARAGDSKFAAELDDWINWPTGVASTAETAVLQVGRPPGSEHVLNRDYADDDCVEWEWASAAIC